MLSVLASSSMVTVGIDSGILVPFKQIYIVNCSEGGYPVEGNLKDVGKKS